MRVKSQAAYCLIRAFLDLDFPESDLTFRKQSPDGSLGNDKRNALSGFSYDFAKRSDLLNRSE